MHDARKTQRFAKFSVARTAVPPRAATHNLCMYVENYGETFESDTWGEFSRWVLLKLI